MKNLLKNFALVLSVLAVSVILSYGVLAWTEPTLTAPAGNVAAPLNTGGATQTKSGGLNLGNLNITGSVGIGTTSPGSKLDMMATNAIDNILRVARTYNSISDDIVIGTGQYSGDGGIRGTRIGVSNGLQFYVNKTFGNSLWNAGGTTAMVIASNSRIGIGTTNPSEKLDVAGTAAADYLRIDPQDGANEGGELQLAGSGSYGTFQIDNYQGHARIHTLASGKQFQVLGGTIYADGTGGSNYFAGNVGIGTATPSQKLDVAGYVKGQTGLCIGNDCRDKWPGAGTGTDQNCASGSVMTGVKSDGTIVCGTGGGSCKANGLACVNNTDCCSALCHTGVCAEGGGILPRSACKGPLPAGNKRIFVTRGGFDASLIPNETAADQKCKDAAQLANMDNFNNFQALVYLGSRNINQVMTTYALFNGKKVTGTDLCDWFRISDGGNDIFQIGTGVASPTNKGAGNYLWSPIKYDEYGIQVNNGLVWTNFRPNASVSGSYQLLSESNVTSPCNGWYADCDANTHCVTCYSYSPGSMGGAYLSCQKSYHWYGSTNAQDKDWSSTVGINNNTAECKANSHQLYCVEK